MESLKIEESAQLAPTAGLKQTSSFVPLKRSNALYKHEQIAYTRSSLEGGPDPNDTFVMPFKRTVAPDNQLSRSSISVDKKSELFLPLQPNFYTPMRRTKEMYRTYIEKSGIMTNLTKLLFRLTEENPRPRSSDFIYYFKKHFAGVIDEDILNIYDLRQQLTEAKLKLDELILKNKRLKSELSTRQLYWEMKQFDSRY